MGLHAYYNNITIFYFWCVPGKTDCIHIFISRYAYLEETGDDFDEEGISLTSSVAKMSGDVKGSSATDHTFREDIEEDKRE